MSRVLRAKEGQFVVDCVVYTLFDKVSYPAYKLGCKTEKEHNFENLGFMDCRL